MTTAPPTRKRPPPAAGAGTAAAPAKPKKNKAAAKEEEEGEEARKKAGAGAAADSATSSDSDASSSDDSDAPSVSDSEDEASSSSSDDEDGGVGKEEAEEIVVDFEFHDPAPIDYLGVRTLLTPLTDGALPFDLSGLASAVVAQTRVGTVVKTEAGGDPIAVITLFNTDRTPREGAGAGEETGRPPASSPSPSPPAFPAIPALSHLRSYLAAHAPSPAAKTALLSAWAGPSTGLLLAERLANLPAAVAPPLHQALAMEVGWAVTDEPSGAGRASFKVDALLYVSRAYVEAGSGECGEVEVAGGSGGGGGGGGKGKGKGKGKAATTTTTPPPSPFPPLVFSRPEDEHFIAASRWAWWFRVPNPHCDRPGDGLAPVRLVACVSAPHGWDAARAALDAAVGNAAAGQDGEE